jgi:hypothetical protein
MKKVGNGVESKFYVIREALDFILLKLLVNGSGFCNFE